MGKVVQLRAAGNKSASDSFYFHGEINDCRAWLRSHGLECGLRGWIGNGQIGTLTWDSQERAHMATRSPWEHAPKERMA